MKVTKHRRASGAKRSMKGRIHRLLMVVGTASVILTALVSMFVFYNLFQQQVFSDLKNYSELLSGGKYLERAKELADQLKEDRQRVTIIDQKGEVLFDSNARLAVLDNHKDRPEIKDAALTGEGLAVRHSETIGKSTYYYAKQLSDGNILRVSLETNDAMEVFRQILPVFLSLAALILGVCFLAARHLTKRIVRPIEQMAEDIEHIEEKAAYEELIPFSRIIQEQHEDIRVKMLDLEKSSRIRQDFTANVSHELKTPLTIISGYAELLEEGMAKPEDVKHFGGEIHRNASRLLSLINDIIQLSELDGEENEPERTIFDLGKLAVHCVEGMQMKAKKHKVNLSVPVKQGCFWLEASQDRLEEMLTNLCDNAIRYNQPQGTVVVSVERVKRAEFERERSIAPVVLSPEPILDPEVETETYEEIFCEEKKVDTYIKLMVQDTGIGIPKAHQERIFERFYRVDKSRSKATGGTGLGLAIVKHIALRNKAWLLLESKEEKGTKISIWFPEKNNRAPEKSF